jgi:hypothetical protein
VSPRQLSRNLAQFHEHPRVVELSTTRGGNALLWAMVALLLLASGWHRFLPVVPLMILAQRYPARRTAIMSLGGIGWLLYRLGDLGVDGALGLACGSAAVVASLYLLYRVARSFSHLPRVVRSNPQISLHLLLWCLAALALMLPEGFGGAAPVAVVLMLGFSIWRVGFMLNSARRGSMARTDFASHLFYCLPSFGGSHTPFGKGYDYLAARRADSRSALARSQLAGVKLLVLASVWIAVGALFGVEHRGAPASLLAPLHGIALRAGEALRPMPLGLAWATLFVEMIRGTLDLAIRGHLIVGCLRLFGFNVFRNTYKPLLATSIVAFWSRYYYYFKELLVDFFFFPTYVACFKGRPRLRIFTATMAAACVGNVYYHLVQDLDGYAQAGLGPSLDELASYLFYAFLLGLGVFVSMLREQGRRGGAVVARSPRRERWIALRKIAGVWLFFSVIRIWDAPHRSFWQNTARFLALFALPSGGRAPHA